MRALFEPGRIVATPGALDALERNQQVPALYLRGHLALDRGVLCAQDNAENHRALKSGARILSAFQMPDGTRLWIITEADRSVTTLLLPEDY